MKIWLKLNRPIDAGADIPLRDEAPNAIKSKYESSNYGEFIFWLDELTNSMGCIKNNRSISMHADHVTTLELQECQPAKGTGYVYLVFQTESGNELGSIGLDEHSNKAITWLKSIQSKISKELNLKVTFSDHGYDV